MTEDKAIAETTKWFPDLKITIDPALNNAKRDPNSKKITDIKRILSKIKKPFNQKLAKDVGNSILYMPVN